MRGRLWLNLGLAIALAVLALVAWRQPGKTPPPAEIKLTTLDTQSVRRIAFHPPRGEGFVLARDGKDWLIEQPRLRAQPFRVETILELPAAVSAAQLALADNKDNSFGVDPPQARVVFDNTEIAFGLTNPVGLRRYVRVGEAVHLIDDRYFHHAASRWTDWVDRRLLPDGVTLTRVQLPDLTLARGGVHWQATPQKPGIGADAIAELVAEWQRAYAMDVEPADAPADTKPLRLEWDGGALDLALARDGDDWLLYRRDAPIRYRFSDNQGQRLLELKEPAPPAAGNAAPADSDVTSDAPGPGDAGND
ncbi:MAG: DUF4340 domain-containing protein [Immundisolibacter sp.]|uniref:DUF4340 domain-containing protein n=1 Tax=Immundisolibacter sp. TaxID=1934948 RepID=UPI003D136CD8